MARLSDHQKTYIQIALIVGFLILCIPLANNETVISLIYPGADVGYNSISGIFFVLFVLSVYAFVKLRKTLKQKKSRFRFLLYVIVAIWFLTGIRNAVGEQIMANRKGIQAIELLAERSKIKLKRDSLGIIHANGNIVFRNFSSDTVEFKGILHGENFRLRTGDSVADIHFPELNQVTSKIKLWPNSIHTYQFEVSKALLKQGGLPSSNYNRTIEGVGKFTVYSQDQKKTLEF